MGSGVNATPRLFFHREIVSAPIVQEPVWGPVLACKRQERRKSCSPTGIRIRGFRDLSSCYTRNGIPSLALNSSWTINMAAAFSCETFLTYKPATCDKTDDHSTILHDQVNGESSTNHKVLGAFVKMRKWLLASSYLFVCLSVCPPVRLSDWYNSAITTRIFMKLDICVFLETLSGEYKFN
jgi:hypothetical protein